MSQKIKKSENLIILISRPYCEMCMEEYRYPPGPKVMAICGHTVCEYCADKYLSDSSNELNTCCPLGSKMDFDNGEYFIG